MRQKKPSGRGRFDRKPPARRPEAKVLIVTEGEKTEVFYFQSCVAALGISSKVTVEHDSGGPTPDRVVAYAKQLADRHFVAIRSYPSFEFWFLLHYIYTTKDFQSKGKLSAGDCVVKELKKYWPEYEKRCETAWDHLHDRKSDALSRAKQVRKAAVETQSENPSTEVDLLLEALEKLAS